MTDLSDCNGAPRVRQPNKAAHDGLMEELNAKIANSEERRRFLQERLRLLRDQQAECRKKRDLITEDRNQVENQLATINKDVNTRSEQAQKLRQNIGYLSEDRINNQIKNLEDLMHKHHYKRAEENKIMMEINRLKKSKKLLSEYNLAKSNLDMVKKQQREIRERRDVLFRERGEVKKSEDKLKRDCNDIRDELEKLKSEIDELYSLRKQTNHEFRIREADYKRFLYEKRSEQRMKRKEAREAAMMEKQKELEEIKANAEPYEEEIKLLGNLIAYCVRFELPTPSPTAETNHRANGPSFQSVNGYLAIPGANPNPRRGSHESGLRPNSITANGGLLTPTSQGSSTYGTPLGVTPVTTPGIEFKENGFIYKKDDSDDNPSWTVSKKTSRRNSKLERRNSRVKALTHNPEIYTQFDQFGLKPPLSSTEVETILGELKQKQSNFEALAREEKERRRKLKNGPVETDDETNSATSPLTTTPLIPCIEVIEPEPAAFPIPKTPTLPESTEVEEAFPSLPEPKRQESGFFQPSTPPPKTKVNGSATTGLKTMTDEDLSISVQDL